MSSIIQALICVSLWAANAMPTNEVGPWAAPQVSGKTLAKRASLWKPLGDRHHLWRFPKYTECGPDYKDIYGYTGYDADYLIKQTRSAYTKTSNPYDKSECDLKVECYRGIYAAYSDQNLLLKMDFKVIDNVKGVGQLIQFDSLYITTKDTKEVVQACSSPDNVKNWWEIPTGNKGRPAGQQTTIAPPPPLSGQ